MCFYAGVWVFRKNNEKLPLTKTFSSVLMFSFTIQCGQMYRASLKIWSRSKQKEHFAGKKKLNKPWNHIHKHRKKRNFSLNGHHQDQQPIERKKKTASSHKTLWLWLAWFGLYSSMFMVDRYHWRQSLNSIDFVLFSIYVSCSPCGFNAVRMCAWCWLIIFCPHKIDWLTDCGFWFFIVQYTFHHRLDNPTESVGR